MQQLDSRASRMPPNQALLTLHADYIGGLHANYRKWYFAAQFNLDEVTGGPRSDPVERKSTKVTAQSVHEPSFDVALERWRLAMHSMSQYDRLRQIALYLLCWGEASNIRFVPECLCFIFKCADDYDRSGETPHHVEPVPEGFYLNTVIKPIYRFICDQRYELVDGRLLRREGVDHDSIIGYDDLNQLFWNSQGIARIVLSNKVGPPFYSHIPGLPSSRHFSTISRLPNGSWNWVA